MDEVHCLVFDLGAGSGRTMLARLGTGILSIKEIDRFDDLATSSPEGPRWDVDALQRNILAGLRRAQALVGSVDAIGIDSWGLDYALLDDEGAPIAPPYHYRNARSLRGHAACPLTEDELFAITGAQVLPVNTVFQLFDEVRNHPERFAGHPRLLMMADVASHFLTGVARSELTLARTSGLLDQDGRWSHKIMETLDLPADIFQPLIRPGEIYGYLRPDIGKPLGWGPIPVISVAAHDTASAVAGLPLGADEAFVICGSWALVGAEAQSCDPDPAILQAGFGYEGGTEGTPFLVRSLNGLHLINGLRRAWMKKTGNELTFAQIGAAVADCAELDIPAIDTTDPVFFHPDDVIAAVNAHHAGHGRPSIEDPGALALSIYKGLVADISASLAFLELRLGSRFSRIRVCGGGGQDATLCALLAKTIGRQVVVGPIEASAWGNALMQLVGIGCVKSLAEGRSIVAASADFLKYEPDDAGRSSGG